MLSAGPTRVRFAVLAVLASLAFLTYLDRICIMRAQEEIARDLGLGTLTPEDEARLAGPDPPTREKLAGDRAKERMGWVFSAFLIGYVLLEIPVGWLGDRWGPRIVLASIVAGWSIFTALTGAPRGVARWFLAEPGPGHLVVALVGIRFCFGLGEAGAFPNIGRALSRWFPFGERASAQGVIWTASRIGGAIAPTALGFLMTTAGGWQGAFFALGGAGILWAMLFLAWFRDRPEDMPRVNAAECARIRSGPVDAGSIYEDDRHGRLPWRKLVFSTNLLAVYLTAACVSFCWYFYVTFLPSYLKETYHVPYDESEIMTGVPLLAGGAACLMGGRLSDWLIQATGSKRWGRSLPGSVGFAAAAVATLFLPSMTTAWGSIALISTICFLQDAAIPCIWSLPADVGGRHAGTVGGCMNAVGALGGALSPWAAARVSSAWGWNQLFIFYAAAYLFGALLWLRIDASQSIVAEDRPFR